MDISYLRVDATGLCGAIGMMSAPGLHRSLELDLAELRDGHQCAVLVSLVGDQELQYLRIADLPARARDHGIDVIRFPIGDHSTPDSHHGVIVLVERLLGMARSGRTLIIHCWAGLGRTGLIAACCLVGCGFAPGNAIMTVRQHRPRAIEDSDQEEFVETFARAWLQGRT